MAWTHIPVAGGSVRGGDARPLNSALVIDCERENLVTLMDEAPGSFCVPLSSASAAFQSSELAYNDASCFWKSNVHIMQPGRTRFVRGLRLWVLAERTAGAGTGSVRIWVAPRWEVGSPGAVPPADYATVEITGIDSGAPTWQSAMNLTVSRGNTTETIIGGDPDLEEEFARYCISFLGGQAIVSAGGTTIEITRLAAEWRNQ